MRRDAHLLLTQLSHEAGANMKRKRLKKDKVGDSLSAYFKDEARHEFFSSGCTLLDCVLGNGWPLGRVSNIVGDKSTGKTLLAIEACANFSATYGGEGGRIKYLEAESAFDKRFASVLGLPADIVDLIEDVDTVEGMYRHIIAAADECIEDGRPCLFVVDSLDSLSSDAEMGREIDTASFGGEKAKKMSELFRKAVRKIKRARMHLMVISQIRDKIGVTFGKKTSRSGGKALDFYASQVLYLAEVGKERKTVKGVQRPVAVNIKAKAEKNKVGMPFRECDFPILFGYGIDSVTASLNFLSTAKELDSLSFRVTKNSLKAFSAKVRAMQRKDRMKVEKEIQTKTKKVWRDIEASFAPKGSKYG